MGDYCGVESIENHDEIDKLLEFDSLSIRVLTWNVAGRLPTDSTLGDKLYAKNRNSSLNNLLHGKEISSDIIAIGLQEIVDLNAKKMMQSLTLDDDTCMKWDDTIHNELNHSKKHKYIKLRSVRLMGILLLIYTKKDLKSEIHDVLENKCGSGLFGIAPNKGAVGVRFEIYNTSICFICAHLAAHKENIEGRNDNYNKIMAKMTFNRNSQFSDDADVKENECMPCLSSNADADTLTIGCHDFVLFFGDLNYRMDYKMEEIESVYTMIEQKMYTQLFAMDQLNGQRLQRNAFDGFEEYEIAFAPTYKFEQGGNGYDQKKQRMPAWCDRILWKTHGRSRGAAMFSKNDHGMLKQTFKCIKYESYNDETMSDHKPVTGLFEMKFQTYR